MLENLLTDVEKSGSSRKMVLQKDYVNFIDVASNQRVSLKENRSKKNTYIFRIRLKTAEISERHIMREHSEGNSGKLQAISGRVCGNK